ncbi:OsmC family protein [Frankia sp. CNm7]|nr:OsmC family protein [Frankia nepalensis]MBL7514204.1 OsmC family protein [Frankia nepalensis]MBL7523071.1 OsmC family protein [Frankia nepalensis]
MTTTSDPAVRNGVDRAALFATLDAVKANPDLARFQFRATNRWLTGTHSQGRIRGFYGAGAEDNTRIVDFVLDADHPRVLTGADSGPTPVEFLLHALAACLTAGLANIAAARGVTLTSVESTVTGDINLLGILGLSDEVRNGYEGIKVDLRVSGDAPDDVLRDLVERSRARSAVYDVLTGGVPVDVTVDVVS